MPIIPLYDNSGPEPVGFVRVPDPSPEPGNCPVCLRGNVKVEVRGAEWVKCDHCGWTPTK